MDEEGEAEMDEEVEEEQNQQQDAAPETQDANIAQVQNEAVEDKKASEVLFENDEQAAGEKQQWKLWVIHIID